MGPIWRADYGVRFDAFQVFSNEFARNFAQVSPRLKITRIYSRRAYVYAYAGRFFTPFSFENVSLTGHSASTRRYSRASLSST